MENTHAERRNGLRRKRLLKRCIGTLSVVVICISCLLIWRIEHQKMCHQERIDNRAFGTIGKIIAIDPSQEVHDHVLGTPILVTLENEDEVDPKIAIVEVRTWITPNVGEVWTLRVVDPDNNGRCTLRLVKRQPRTYPWKKKGNASPSNPANQP